jgi:carbonic anhydrase
MTKARAALDRLAAGNQRFVSGNQALHRDGGQERRMELATKHEPVAIILGCSDARVPAEIIFDQGPGDLFVIRVAGNIVAPSQIGSVEFAAARFGIPLVVLLGHSDCGAVRATLDEIQGPSEPHPPSLTAIVDRIRPALEPLAQDQAEPGSLMQQAVRANVMASVRQLRHGSELVEQLIRLGQLKVVGAEYSIETGCVDFFTEPETR